MNKVVRALTISIIASISIPLILTQEREDRTLLSWAQMRAIINEVSGERALHTVLELVPYPRIRPHSEYEGHFRETEVTQRFAKEFGFQNAEIESYPAMFPSWNASQGELWMTEPESRKLCDIYDVAVSLCSGSESGDVTAELVDVGFGGRAEDFAGKDVKGKIVLGSAGANNLQRLAVAERGAVGILSYNSQRADDYPDQVLSQGITSPFGAQAKNPGFGWSIAPRLGRELARTLAQGRKITLRSLVKAESLPGETELVHAVIPGDGSADQELMVTAHLYEGYTKQGANDDSSGCAATLEMGRAYIRLVQEGKLPPPRRTIHFLWVPEIMGTMTWLEKHKDVGQRLIADLNFDMEGLGLRLSSSAWTLHRTPDTLPTYLNDVCASMLEFVAELNRERVRYRSNGYGFALPIVAPTGSHDPFYYVIDKFYGASDHVVFINQGIPAAMFITWPDMFYHSSMDTPDKLDPTQFKRAAVVGTGVMSLLAAAEDDAAARITAESFARGTERMGRAQRKGLSYLTDARDASSLGDAFKEARTTVRHQASVEKAVVRSSAILFKDRTQADKDLAGLESLVEQRAAALMNEVRAIYEMQARLKNVPPAEPAITEAEAKAGRTIAERPGGQEGLFGSFMRAGAQRQAIEKLPPEDRKTAQAAMEKIPQHMTSELNALLRQKRTVLEIRDFLSGEFEPLPLADLMDYLRAQEKLGALKLTEKPEEPKPAPSAPQKKIKKN